MNEKGSGEWGFMNSEWKEGKEKMSEE